MLKLINNVFRESSIFSEVDSEWDTPLFAKVTASSDLESKVTIITGSNASGKSLGIRLLAAWLHEEKPKVEPIQVSMRYRTEGGIARAFMYGPFGDSIDSTGAISISALQGALRTAKARTTPSWVMLDEPDIGLSEDFTFTLGEFLAQNANEGLGEHCRGLVVVTHSRALVKGICEHLATPPHFVHVDEQPRDLEGWLASGRKRTVEELVDLSTKSVMTYRKLMPYLKEA